MMLNASRSWSGSLATTSCDHHMIEWEELMDKMYTYFYLLLFIPGLLLNTIALWVLCRHVRKKTKTVIFMINLALADLIHTLSLPLRIYYYLTHTWPFGHNICLLCFYLKYLNMYAAIGFLMCISVQRCVFLLHPFATRRWRSRYDLAISVLVWVLVGLACSPFIIMRASSSDSPTFGTSQAVFNTSAFLHATSTQRPAAYITHNVTSLNQPPSANAAQVRCFKDLPMRRVPVLLAVTLMVLAELFGFLIPLASISCSSICISRSLYHNQASDNSLRHRSSFTSADNNNHDRQQSTGEKRRALRMVLSCSVVFLLCFAPYHMNFLLYLMVQQDLVSDCAFRLAVLQFHPVSLCLASLSCCLNPLLYYFLTAEFRLHLSRRSSTSVSSHTAVTHRLLSFESSF
nr:putative P2Y purinoceptor 10 isoform X2 [Doryrhamphus excisus]